MFNWILDIRAACSPSKAKKRVAYYGRRADLINARNLMHDARNIRKVAAETVRVAKETRKVERKLKAVA